MKSLLKSFLANREGAIAIITAVALPALIGTVALVAEFGHGLLTKAENQRVADLAAYAGAVALNATGSEDEMGAAVASVAVLNGVPADSATASIIASPRGNGSDAVSVTIATENVLLLAPIVGADSSLPISASAAAEIAGGTPGCIIALDPAQSGVTLTGGTEINAPDCGISSNSSVSVPCGTEIFTVSLTYDSASPPSEPCNGIQPPAGKNLKVAKMAVDDPLAGDPGVAAATARVATVATQTGPAAPSVTVPTGTDITFTWWDDPNFITQIRDQTDCEATYSDGWAIVTCPAGQTYNFGTVTVHRKGRFELSGTGSTTFNFSGEVIADGEQAVFPAATYNFARAITVSGSAQATFGAGTFNIAQGVKTSGGTTTTFGAGTFNIGSMTGNCGGARHSICHEGTTLTFGGPSTFVLPGGIYNKGGSTLTLGAGSTNSFDIGPSSAGNAFTAGGGSKTTFADANGGLFRMSGHFNVAGGGGTCVTISAADQHDIKGNFWTAGGTVFGAGVYTVTGSVAFGKDGGGNVTCGGASIGVVANNVSLVVGGTTTPSSGTCSGQAFCIGAGYNTVILTAPTAGDTAKLAVIGPGSGLTAGALFTQGASNTSLSGAFYFPSGPVSLSGGAVVGNGPGECLQLIGSRVSLSGGTALASACLLNTASLGGVVLVQ